MNKAIIFAGGIAVGAISGSIVTYFALVKKLKAECDAEIERYAAHCEERISRLSNDEEDDISEESEEEDSDEPLNEGVKKYHQGNVVRLDQAYNSVFAKEGEVRTDVVEEIKESAGDFDKLEVVEITEKQFDESEYTKQELDYEFIDEDDHPGVLTMYGSDELAEDHYNLSRDQIISETWKWAPDYVDDNTGVGAFYIQNDILRTVFKVNVIMPTEEDNE